MSKNMRDEAPTQFEQELFDESANVVARAEDGVEEVDTVVIYVTEVEERMEDSEEKDGDEEEGVNTERPELSRKILCIYDENGTPLSQPQESSISIPSPVAVLPSSSNSKATPSIRIKPIEARMELSRSQVLSDESANVVVRAEDFGYEVNYEIDHEEVKAEEWLEDNEEKDKAEEECVNAKRPELRRPSPVAVLPSSSKSKATPSIRVKPIESLVEPGRSQVLSDESADVVMGTEDGGDEAVVLIIEEAEKRVEDCEEEAEAEEEGVNEDHSELRMDPIAPVERGRGRGVDRGGPRGRRRGRGRVSRDGAGRGQSGPRVQDMLVIRDISEMPLGHGLETPLHPKRRRLWQPSKPTPVISPVGVSAERHKQPVKETEMMLPSPGLVKPIESLVEPGRSQVLSDESADVVMGTEDGADENVVLIIEEAEERVEDCEEEAEAEEEGFNADHSELRMDPIAPVERGRGRGVDRGGPRGRRRGRGRVSRDGAGRGQSGPRVQDRLVIRDISEMPLGHGLETPLHPKRRRLWQPSSSSPHGGETTPETRSSPSVQRSSPSAQHLNDEDIAHGTSYGSEASSESDDDELVSPFIPRVYRSALETPMDEDADDAADPPLPAITEPEIVTPTATERPWSLYDFDWRMFPDPPIPPESRRETFSESNVGPTTPHADPYDIFVDIWDRQFMEYIASETNRYAQQVVNQMISDHNLHPNSRITQWRDTTADELYLYFGIIIAMGVVVKTRQQEYWCGTPDIFYTPGFSAHMSRNRFVLLNKCLHFNNNADMCAQNLTVSEAKLFKIQPLLSHLNQKFQSLYRLRQNLSIDESLLQWKGWLDVNQLVPNNVATMGIKSYEVCESQTGYLWRFEIHAHKRSPAQQSEDPLKASTSAIVLRLIHGLENKGYTLWMDNFYNSPCLARHLKSLGFDCVGTLRTNRQFVPQVLHNLIKEIMRPGQITGLTSGDVDIMVWRDKNRVSIISTYHGNAVKEYGGYPKPTSILDYNIVMGGVDKKDQMLAMYPMERKRTKVWYKKLFRRLLNVSVLNSYIIHRHSSSLSHRQFRMSLIKSLLSKHSPTPTSVARPLPLSTTTRNTPVDISHRLAEFPLGKHQRKRLGCKVCKKRVRTYCVGCSKSVCIDTCFVILHS